MWRWFNSIASSTSILKTILVAPYLYSRVGALGLMLALTGCESTLGYHASTSQYQSDIRSNHESGGIQYFPNSLKIGLLACNWTGVATQRAVLDDQQFKALSDLFATAKEPSLYAESNKQRHGEISQYRVTIFSNRETILIIRVVFPDSGSGAIVAQHIIRNNTKYMVVKKIDRYISNNERILLDRVLGDANLSNIPPVTCELGMDPITWVVESADSQGYHFITRLNPQSGPIKEIGEHLLRLTGWGYRPE